MPNKKNKQGRRGGLQEARELINLLGSLAHKGNTVNADVISQRMGVSQKEARKLMDLLETVGIEENAPLTLYQEADNELTVAFDNGRHGMPLRLTKSETVALNAALNYLQVPTQDPLRYKLNKALGSPAIDAEVIQRTIAPAKSPIVRSMLYTIAQAIADDSLVQMNYQSPNDSKPKKRTIQPKTMRRIDSSWLIDGYDLDRNANRTFRADRITSCSIVDVNAIASIEDGNTPESSIVDSGNTSDNQRLITLQVYDEQILQTYTWPGCKVISRTPECITITIPYYGRSSQWLPRMLAACGSKIRCEDKEINDQVARYAQQQLSQIK